MEKDLKILKSITLADGPKYFSLFEKHIPTLNAGSRVYLYMLGNLHCICEIIKKNPTSKYFICDTDEVFNAVKLVLDGYDISKAVDLYDNDIDMKFDCIIMVPPYKRNLPLKILAEAIKHLKDENSVCVNLSPIRWLQDPLAKYKKNNDYHRFENSVSKFCNTIELVKTEDVRQLFNVELLRPLAIYKCDKKTTYSYYKEYFKNAAFIDKVFKKILSENNFEKHKCVKFSDNLKNFVLLNIIAPPMKYGKPPFDAVKTWCGYFVNGKNSLGLTYRQSKENNSRATRGNIEQDNAVIFNTEDEAKNCYNAMQTNFVKFFVMTSVVDVHVHQNVIPWMENYTQPWDDARFYKYFDITPEEQKIIEDTMAKYVK